MAEDITLTIQDIGRLDVRGFVSFSEDYEQEITSHPVEEHAPITDNIEPQPDVVNVEIIVGGLRADPNPYYGMSLEQLREAVLNLPEPVAEPAYVAQWKQLLEAKNKGLRITVTTERGAHKNMVIKRLSSPIEKELGYAARIVLTLRKIDIAVTGIAVVPEVQLGKSADLQGGNLAPQHKDRHGGKSNQGRTTPQTPSAKGTAKQASLELSWA